MPTLFTTPLLLALLFAAAARALGWETAPIVGAGASLLALLTITLAWRKAQGTALRPALLWAGIAIGLGAVGQLEAMKETAASGRPNAGGWIHLSTLAALAASLTVLNARRPGSRAWGMLMSMLVVVFLLPWLEGAWMVRHREGWDRLRLAAPWNYFFGLLAFVGATNYLPTRRAPAALALGAGFVLAGLALVRTDWSTESRGALLGWVPWCWSLAVFAACVVGSARAGTPFDRLWLWFRDRWGVVWALRTRDRFNATAAAASWGFRLDWSGAVPTTGDVPDEAVATLAGLLRRFADRRVIEAESRGSEDASLAERAPRGDD